MKGNYHLSVRFGSPLISSWSVMVIFALCGSLGSSSPKLEYDRRVSMLPSLPPGSVRMSGLYMFTLMFRFGCFDAANPDPISWSCFFLPPLLSSLTCLMWIYFLFAFLAVWRVVGFSGIGSRIVSLELLRWRLIARLAPKCCIGFGVPTPSELLLSSIIVFIDKRRLLFFRCFGFCFPSSLSGDSVVAFTFKGEIDSL